ncbi:uncharacterized protein [Rutidosis leptorrhynchoides]|uniref:uncharacterized protein isoform X2 n=1 Tax=Rutidosis leptorrhynchoides TaxID=125765 RepID=UPI003A9A064F
MDDKRRSPRVKNDEKYNPKKKTVNVDSSLSSSSRRSSRETPSKKQAKESPAIENVSSVRKSVRLEKTKSPGTTPASSDLKSNKGKVVKSLEKSLTKDKGHEKQGLNFGGKKRKRVADCKQGDVDDDDGDDESQEMSSQVNSSSSIDVDTELGKTDKDDSGDDVKESLDDMSNTDLCENSDFKDRTASKVENNNDMKNKESSEECNNVPCKLLKKRSVLFSKPSKNNTGNVLDCHLEWLVQWSGLNDDQATWVSENSSVLNSAESQNLIQEYEKHHALSDDKIEDVRVKLPTVPAGYPPGMDDIHLSYVMNLHDAWKNGPSSIIFDDQDRIIRIVLFIFSLKDVNHPFLLITTSDSVSQWEDMFIKIASCNAFKVSLEDTDMNKSFRLLQVQNEDGQLIFQLLLYNVNLFAKDINVLKSIKFEAVIIDECQSSDISSRFSYIKNLSTYKRLFVFCSSLGVSMTSYHDVLLLLDCDVIPKTDLDDVSKLKEALSNVIAYECKRSSSRFVEYWVPVQISNVQLEQYCCTLLSNAMALSSCSKSDSVGVLHDILVTNRKCCDHPYIVDPSLQESLTKDLGLSEITDVVVKGKKILDVGIKASGKLQFLDAILPVFRKRKRRVLILFQPISGSGKESVSIGDILDDFIRQRFGQDSYERVDGVGIVPSKKQAALNNFNNKEMGRFIFLLEYRACLPSIKLSSIDAVIVFDSEWNPANDIRALQKIAIDSRLEQIMIFRLYTPSTLEEKILKLAEDNNVTIDSKTNISKSISESLLMWDAKYLFNKLDEFHSGPGLDTRSKERWLNELMEDFVNLISSNSKKKDALKLIVAKVQPVCGVYGKNVPVKSQSQPDEELPHAFWKRLLTGRDQCWRYLSRSTSRQRKRTQQYESPKKTYIVNDDVGRKRKKTATNVVESVSPKPVIEEGEIVCTYVVNDDVGRKRKKTATNVVESVSPKPVIEEGNSGVVPQKGSKSGDEICNEMSFGDQLKEKISKLCEVLGMSKDVKILVEKFLKYVIDNYHVNKEPTSTVEAFLISLSWIGSEILKQKLDRSQSVALAKQHLNYSCKEEVANSVYLKLEPAKEMFLSQMKTDSSTELENPKSPKSPKCPKSPFNQNDAECGGVIIHTDQDGTHNSNNTDSSCADVLKETVASVQEIHNECIQDNAVQTLEEHIHANAEDTQQQTDSNSADKVPEPSQNPNTPFQVLESSAKVPDRANGSKSNVLNGQGSGNHNQQGVTRKSNSNQPLQAEVEKLNELKDAVVKCHETIKEKLQSEYDKELAEVIVQLNKKYEAKIQDADMAFQLKKKEVDICYNRAIINKVLADMYRSKCQDMTPFKPAEIQMIKSGGMRYPSESRMQPSLQRPVGVSGSQPPLQIVHRSSQLFSSPPNRPPYNTTPLTMPTRPPFSVISTSTPTGPLSTTATTSMPSRAPSTAILTCSPSITPPSVAISTSTPSRPPPYTTIPTSSTLSRPPPSTTISASTPSRPPPSTTISTITLSRPPPSTTIPASTPSRPPLSTAIPTSTPSRPPLSTAIPTSTPSRPPSSTAIPTSTPNRPPSSTTIPTSTPNSPPSSTSIPTSTPSIPPSTVIPTSTPIRPPSTVIPTSTPTIPPSTTIPTSTPSRPPSTLNRPPLDINSITTTISNRTPRAPSEIRAPAPHIRPFSSQRMISSTLPMSQSPVQTPLQTPPSLTTNLHDHPNQSSSQPPSSTPVPQPVSLFTTSSAHFHASLPPMPSVTISHTGLYNAHADILNQPALNLLMDMDRQAGLHQSNTFSSLTNFLDPTDSSKEDRGNDFVCLSDDD